MSTGISRRYTPTLNDFIYMNLKYDLSSKVVQNITRKKKQVNTASHKKMYGHLEAFLRVTAERHLSWSVSHRRKVISHYNVMSFETFTNVKYIFMEDATHKNESMVYFGKIKLEKTHSLYLLHMYFIIPCPQITTYQLSAQGYHRRAMKKHSKDTLITNTRCALWRHPSKSTGVWENTVKAKASITAHH